MVSMEYKVSVIIPMYDRADVVGHALESVFRQSLDGIEIIVVDDGSQDNSVEVVEEYQKEHRNIKLFKERHEGPGHARNVGIKNATGKYIVFLDSDDTIPERAYELMYETAEAGKHDFVVGQMLRKIDTINQGKWFVPEKIGNIIRSYVGKNCAQGYDLPLANPSSCNRMIRRDFLLENELFFSQELFGEDTVYNLKLFRCARSATAIDEIVYCYETNYKDKSSTISAITLEATLSGMRSVDSYALFFDSIGRIDWEIEALLGPFEFVLQRFKLLPEEDKEIAFEAIKEHLKRYRGRKEYEIPITYLMGMGLETLLLLPYPAYERCKTLLPAASPQKGGAKCYVQRQEDSKEVVLKMYREGKIGFRYIIKYFKAWLKYKLHQR